MKILEKIQRTLSLILKELELLLKDKQALLIVFLLPILVILALGISGYLSNDQALDPSLVIGVVDLDTSSGWVGEDLSVNFTKELSQKANIINISYAEYDDNMQWRYLSDGIIDGYIIIPLNFEFYLSVAEIPAYINVTLDSTNLGGQANVISVLTETIAEFKIVHNLTRDELLPVISYEWYSDQRQSHTLRVLRTWKTDRPGSRMAGLLEVLGTGHGRSVERVPDLCTGPLRFR